jgi:hypothetical protein
MPELRGYTVEWAEPGSYLLSKRNRLYHALELKLPLRRLGDYPAPKWRCAATHVRPLQRALRFLYYNVLKLGGGEVFATFGHQVGVFRGNRFHLLDGIERPHRVLRGAAALDGNGDVYFGEYHFKKNDYQIHIYRYTPGDSRVHVVYRFAPGQVRHVHGIYFDPFENCLLCLTGDRGSECRIIKSRDGFNTVETIGAGDESWRAVSVQFTDRSIFYGTDAEFRTNHIYRVDRSDGKRADLGRVNGPVYYSKAAGGELFFAVTAELCPSQTDRAATLWRVNNESTLAHVASFEKDWLSTTYFMPGTLHFAAGPGVPGELLVQGVGLKQADNRTFRVSFTSSAGPQSLYGDIEFPGRPINARRAA